jgi:hypothetical protein
LKIMALSYRHRAALLLAGALISTPVWATAGAATPPTVIFSGHQLLSLGALSCSSSPSVSRLTVPAGTTVDFANKLGEGATLWAGDSHKHLNNGEMVPVTFSSGPASIVMQMLPDCSLDLGTHDQMTVAVTAPNPASPPVTSPPAGNGGVAPSPTSGGHTTGPSGKSTRTKSPKPSKSPSTSPSASSGVAAGNGDGGQGLTPKGNDDPFATPTAQDTSSNVTLGDPIGTADTRHGASGLLTLIATVCVVGVTAAAIRAIIAQRATRALSA